MGWVLHDDFKTKRAAKAYGKKIVQIGLAKGVKVVQVKKKVKFPFKLYILSLERQNVKN